METTDGISFARVEYVLSAHTLGQLPGDNLPEIAFAGRSNVGKSSLINRLVNRKSLVKVSAQPGKTRSLNFFIVDSSFYLVDLPGYGYAKVPQEMREQWGRMISRYLDERETLCGVVVIVDSRHSAKAHDLELMDWLRSRGIPFVPVYTKIDKLSGGERRKNAAALDAAFGVLPEDRVLFSSKTGAGRESLINIIAELVSKQSDPLGDQPEQ